MEVQKWRSDAEFTDRKLRNCEEELRNAKAQIKELKNDLESKRGLGGSSDSDLIHKHARLESEFLHLDKVKQNLELTLKQQQMEFQKLQFEFEDQLALWKKEKDELTLRLQEV